MTRTDAHRPAAIVPTDYDFVGFQYLRVDDLADAMFLQSERRRIEAHKARTGGERSGHAHGGNCDVCGSAFAVYKALFWHRPTNTYVSTGLDCAEKLQCDEVAMFRRSMRDAMQNKAGKAKAQAILETEGLGAAWSVYTAAPVENQPFEESTIREIVGKLVQYGSVSDKQLAFVGKLIARIADRAAIEAQRAAEAAAAKPVPVSDKRVTVKGKVLSVKVPNERNGEFGPVRMLVQHADGWKVWGSVPSNILADVKRDLTVQFDATVKASDHDTKFGFFSRPTKAQIVGQAA